jgi:hypothetical protein
MISKCANPQCTRILIRMGVGRFYVFAGKDNATENFWLCGNCAVHFTLRQIEGRVELLRKDRKTA